MTYKLHGSFSHTLYSLDLDINVKKTLILNLKNVENVNKSQK